MHVRVQECIILLPSSFDKGRYTSISDNVLATYVLDLFQAKKVYISKGHFAKPVKSQLQQQFTNRALELLPLPVIYMSVLQSPPPPLPLLTTYHTQTSQFCIHFTTFPLSSPFSFSTIIYIAIPSNYNYVIVLKLATIWKLFQKAWNP